MEPPAQPWQQRPAGVDSGPDYAAGPRRHGDEPAGFGPLPGYGPNAPAEGVEDPVVMRPDGPARARTGLVMLIAFLIELVAVVAWGNQWVSDRVARDLGHVHSGFLRNLLIAALTYRWRFDPQGSSDFGHEWLAQLMLVVAFLVFSTLLVAVAARGVVTFWRAFFGTWTAVLAATVLAAMVRGAIVDPGTVNISGRSARATGALFGPLGPTQYVVVAGIGLGAIVALVTAIVAVSTRRRPMVAVTAEPAGEPAQPIAAPPPFYGDVLPAGPIPPDDQPTAWYGAPGSPYDVNSPTGAMPSRAPDTETRRLPAVDPAPIPQQAGPGPAAGREPVTDLGDDADDETVQFARPERPAEPEDTADPTPPAEPENATEMKPPAEPEDTAEPTPPAEPENTAEPEPKPESQN